MKDKPFFSLKYIISTGLYEIDIKKGEIYSQNGKRIGFIDKRTGYRLVKLNAGKQHHIYREQDVIAAKSHFDLTNGEITHKNKDKLDNRFENLRFTLYKKERFRKNKMEKAEDSL